MNRKTAAFYFLRLREIIAYELEAESEAMFGGEIEVDESYFGGRRKGKRGRGAFEYLFCPIYRGNAIDRGLNPTTIKRAIKKAAKLAGFEKSDVKAFSGHSMRVGAAQDLLCAGFDTIAIMRAGGWTSVEVLPGILKMQNIMYGYK